VSKEKGKIILTFELGMGRRKHTISEAYIGKQVLGGNLKTAFVLKRKFKRQNGTLQLVRDSGEV